MRLLVPRCRCAGGVRPGPHRHGVTCADHGVWVFAVGLGAVDPDTHRRRLVCRVVAASSTLGAVPRVLVWDGEGAVRRWWARQPELTAACHAFRGTLAAKVWICKPVIPKPRGWSNVSTTTWSGRSCRVGSLPLRRISIPSCRPGWCGPITASTECWDVDRQIASRPIPQRC